MLLSLKRILAANPYIDFHNFGAQKSPLRESCDKKLHNFEPQFDKNCSFGLKEDFFEKRYSSNLSLLIMPYQATKFGKNPYSRYCDISLYNFRPQSNQNCPFDPIEDFLEIALK